MGAHHEVLRPRGAIHTTCDEFCYGSAQLTRSRGSFAEPVAAGLPARCIGLVIHKTTARRGFSKATDERYERARQGADVNGAERPAVGRSLDASSRIADEASACLQQNESTFALVLEPLTDAMKLTCWAPEPAPPLALGDQMLVAPDGVVPVAHVPAIRETAARCRASTPGPVRATGTRGRRGRRCA